MKLNKLYQKIIVGVIGIAAATGLVKMVFGQRSENDYDVLEAQSGSSYFVFKGNIPWSNRDKIIPSLAAGDFDGDGDDDVLIGAPGEVVYFENQTPRSGVGIGGR